ncbi:MAG: hypothetical protein LBQ54_13410 [Planctomycetaceae bacterium]|jgi:hypothetical protein|nr:hypothetical protein [Planctomycetaceae bacterium]
MPDSTIPLVMWFLIPLSLTILIESAAAWLLGIRTILFYASMICINLMTNPPFCFFLLLFYRFNNVPITLITVILEVMIVLIEWRLLVWVFPQKSKSMFGLSLTMNGSSYLIGVLIQYVLSFL